MASRHGASVRFLITGSAGFIGFHLAKRLLADGHMVCGIDAMTPYYDVRLKEQRHAILMQFGGFAAHVARLEDMERVNAIVADARADVILHCAAQAGVRFSFENPRAYLESNVIGTFNLLEATRQNPVRHFIFASTSSVYGANAKTPFCETDRAAHPLSIYAATKIAGEAIAHDYAHLWKIPITVARFFTIYGPWGRPDMALFKFVDAILNGKPIEIYGEGLMSRDFTYVDDLVEAMLRLVACVPATPALGEMIEGDSLSPVAPFRIVNIGRGSPIGLLDFVEILERKLGREAERRLLPMQPGDVPATYASSDLLERLTGYRPATPIETGVAAFVDWYRGHHKL
jgi:UDP-glucuronate 4-epimerase